MTEPQAKKKKSSKWFYVLVFCMVVMFGTLSAQNPVPPKPVQQTSTLLSRYCDESKIRLLADPALISIVPNSATSYTITLDTAIMTFTDLTKKMQQAGCF